jgi:hypothetical protein
MMETPTKMTIARLSQGILGIGYVRTMELDKSVRLANTFHL